MSVTQYAVEKVDFNRVLDGNPDTVYTVIRENPHKFIAAYHTKHAADEVARVLNQWAGSQFVS